MGDLINESPLASKSIESRAEPAQSAPRLEPLRLQPDREIVDAASYSLGDLLQYHDKAFVLNAYAAIAKREPEPSELEQTLYQLRGGLRTKTAILEELVAKHPNVRVDGLSSPTVRVVSRWPVIGYLVRVLRAVGRLPLVIQHQQQFEAYISGQQQRLTDYINDVIVNREVDQSGSMRPTELVGNVSDAIKTVMMLSDSLVELSASVQELQNQQEKSEAQLHADLVVLTQKITEQQQHLEEIRRTHELAAASQREFLINEQRSIVEAQRAAVGDLEEQLNQAINRSSMRATELATELRDLRAALEGLQQAALRK